MYSLAENEKILILHVLHVFGGNKTHTAKALGIGLRTLQRKLISWGGPPAKAGRQPNKKGDENA